MPVVDGVKYPDGPYIAWYMPWNDGPDPSRSGFETTEEAWEWIYEHCMCSACKKEREAALAGETWVKDEDGEYMEPSAAPPCSAEWDVCHKDEFIRGGTEIPLTTQRSNKLYPRIDGYEQYTRSWPSAVCT